MSDGLTIRPGTFVDIAGVDALLARSYPVLLKPDYATSVLVTALPLISRAQPDLVTCGTYYVAADADGGIVGAGGWTRTAPGSGRQQERIAHIRHVVTDHRRTRDGIGRRLMAKVFADVGDAGIARLDCLSTRTAVPFYQAMGFIPLGPFDVPLGQGIVFPVIAMQRAL